MCDFSLQMVKSRPAKVEDQLTVKDFGHGTTGFCASEDESVAVCLLPGTELAFDEPIKVYGGWFDLQGCKATTAIFRQINKEQPRAHHDALETPDGQIVLLTRLAGGQKARVLQLPAAPKTEAEAEEQKRLDIVG